MVLPAMVKTISNTPDHLECASTMIKYDFPGKDRQNQFALSAIPLWARTMDTKVELPAYSSQLSMKCSFWQSLQYSSQDVATKHNFRPNSSSETSQGGCGAIRLVPCPAASLEQQHSSPTAGTLFLLTTLFAFSKKAWHTLVHWRASMPCELQYLTEAKIYVSSLLDFYNCDWQALHPRHQVDAHFGGLSFLRVNWMGSLDISSAMPYGQLWTGCHRCMQIGEQPSVAIVSARIARRGCAKGKVLSILILVEPLILML